MGLATYKSCSFKEKRAVLQAFWSGRANDSEKINHAAREYGPYALCLVGVITLEVFLIAAFLIVRANGWSWLASAATVLSFWSLWWSIVCRRRINAPLSSH